jgi:hypothetical protein
VTASFIFGDSSKLPQGSVAALDQALGSVVVEVQSRSALSLQANEERALTVSGDALFLADRTDVELLNAVQGARVVSRSGVLNAGLSGSGNVTVVDDQRVQGVFISTPLASVVNMGVLTGSGANASLAVYVVRHGSPSVFEPVTGSGSSGDMTVGCAVEASSGSLNGLRTSSDCLAVESAATALLNTSGSYTFQINVTYGNVVLMASQPFELWLPGVPMVVSVDRRLLEPVAQWARANASGSAACSDFQHQWSSVDVEATFKSGQQMTRAVSVSSLLDGAMLSLSNSSLGRVRRVAGAWVVQGLATGSFDVVVMPRSGSQAGLAELGRSLNVTVAAQSRQPAVVAGLDAVFVSRITASVSDGGVLPTLNSTVGVTLGVERDIVEREGAVAGAVVVSAVFVDGTRMVLGVGLPSASGFELDDGHVTLSSLAPRSVGVSSSGDAVVVPFNAADGEGSLLSVEWRSSSVGTCTARLIGRGDVTLAVRLPAATGARVASSEVRIAPDADEAARNAGYDVESVLAVTLEYPGSSEVDATADTRTSYRIVVGSTLAQLNLSDSGRPRLVALNASGGVVQVEVTFSHENVSARVNVTVVRALDLEVQASPFPSYSNSDRVQVTTLAPLGGSNPVLYQECVVRATLVLSDGTRTDVSNQAGGKLTLVSPTSLMQVSVVSQQLQVVVNGSAADALSSAQNVTLSASFLDRNSVSGLQLLVSKAAVAVSGLQAFALRGASSNTLLGAANATTDRLRVGAVLADGRELPELVSSSGVLLVPGLLVFSSSDDQVLSADSSSGLVTLRGNSIVGTSLQVSATGGSSATASLTAFGNLQAEEGDFDLGALRGAPVPGVIVGSDIRVPVFVNSGGTRSVGAYELQVAFNGSRLSFQNVTASVSGLFDFNVVSSSGGIVTVRFGGQVAGTQGRGQRVQVAELVLRAEAAGVAAIST